MKRKCINIDYGRRSTKRPKILYEISDLPNEMLHQIFKCLSLMDRRNAMLVSTFWMQLMNKYFPGDNTIVLDGHSRDYYPNGRMYEIFQARLTQTRCFRNFSGLVIKCLPQEFSLDNLMKFLLLVQHEIRTLKIFSYRSLDLINHKLYAILLKLEALEVASENLLGDFSFPPNLKSIKVNSVFTNLKNLEKVQKIKSLESFTVKSILITRKELTDEATMEFMEENTKVLLEKMVEKDAYKKYSIELETKFNFHGDAKLAAKDISQIALTQNHFNLAPLANFCGLKKLVIIAMDQNSTVITSKVNFQLFGVTHLEIMKSNGNFQNLDHQFFSHFPDLESLTINDIMLNDENFRSICEHMPKLKELNYHSWSASKISIKTVFAADAYSIKDLPNLETFWMKTKSENVDATDLKWPSLPHMKKICLSGEGFHSLNKNFYFGIAQKSPKLHEIRLDYVKYPESSPSKFFPLLAKLNLVHLTLPGEGELYSDDNNSALVGKIVKHCKHLKWCNINDGVGFSLQQEIQLLRSLPKLQCVASADMSGCIFRETYRDDVKDLKKYLAKELSSYKDLQRTINYLYDFEIPHEDRLRMEESFRAGISVEEDEEDEEFETWYIVMHDFLKMSPRDMCKAFYYTTCVNL
ncbi:uncharacterized protein LOC134827264 [Culicoides brevitarsis]|uniref:uncharacterized protein LOC134827264 n=1 Tax=Culicoides brevitarsis TaxID=469753 RepID=UPI00307C9743